MMKSTVCVVLGSLLVACLLGSAMCKAVGGGFGTGFATGGATGGGFLVGTGMKPIGGTWSTGPLGFFLPPIGFGFGR